MSGDVLYRAPNRGAEGGGLPVAWERMPDVSSFDLARDTIAASDDRLMWRIVWHVGSVEWSGAWTNVEGKAVQVRRLSWAPSVDCVTAWSSCETPGPMTGEIWRVFSDRDAGIFTSRIIRSLLNVAPTYAADAHRALLDALDVEILTGAPGNTESALGQAYREAPWERVMLRPSEVSDLAGAAVGLVHLWNSRRDPRRVGGKARHTVDNGAPWDPYAPHRIGHYLGDLAGEARAVDAVRRVVTPDMVFSALAERARDGR